MGNRAVRNDSDWWLANEFRTRTTVLLHNGAGFLCREIGQTSNLGLVSAVFFREARPVPFPITPPPRPYPMRKEGSAGEGKSDANEQAPSAGAERGSVASDRRDRLHRSPMMDTQQRASVARLGTTYAGSIWILILVRRLR